MTAALEAVAALAPEAGLVADPDPALFGQALAAAVTGVARNPRRSAALTLRLAGELAGTAVAAVSRVFGASTAGPLPVDPKDRRFADPTWEDNPYYFAIRQAYLALGKYALDLAEAAQLERSAAAKAELILGVLVDALSPTNFLPTNPAAVKRAFETGGRSIIDGLRNFTDDLINNGGMPRQVDTTPFEVGRNLAATPAKVVYRSDLIEVLQYLPQTDRVHQIPILCSPPWINKYYVMDLAPGRSFIEWAVQRGHTVFAISYRNPDAAMSGTTMDDYLIDGPRTALDVVCETTGSDTVHVVGLCLGGAMTLMTAAYLAGIEDRRIGSITLLNTLVDFANPGALQTFTDAPTVAKLEKKMAKKGYLEGSEMAGTFDLLRANDLIFNYVVSNWLMGKQPPAFDILAWNADSTRMPAAMHSFYLRSCYVENRFVNGELELAGRHLDLADIKQPLYIVAAINDHIVPWQSSYETINYVPGTVRFVLSSGGHIAGIVNPPSPKAWYMTADGTHPTSEAWQANAEKHAASWWEDWANWAGEHGGPMIDPPTMGSDTYPVLGDGPGEYVQG
ncbi:PHA/PHB synthase family protein [[Mycobacterium] crassicus]|uniref:Alpha/beta fold hydrolase n=1 Tax=[Mycobacterium] crassicus TaxID=2872309 RepID=A0ABU5XIS9_9MYCO|nr:alpha/beta fold hydrolase [Mycolicibacter sp. MYC098]MEB3022111.1 alpha/beta fold hydrolase [Mycolicibacter sp. MYC098]